MIIQELFSKPINREIKAAVTVSDRTPAIIEAEISEYVFTDDLIDKLFRFLSNLVNSKSGDIGIWINGYYGSGKSHFLKYINYCLQAEYSQQALGRLSEAIRNYDNSKPGNNDDITESNLRLIGKKLSETTFETIIFNVENVTSDGHNERLTRIFLNMFNQLRGYNSTDIPLAILFEKYLFKKGKLDIFKQELKARLNYNWDTEASQVAEFELSNILNLGKEFVPELDVERLNFRLTNRETYHISIADTLIPELKEYVKEKPDNYRLLFMVDEVSQYIGTNKEILLNLQTIVEEIGISLGNKVWITCTAQQTLDDVVQNMDSADRNDEFGKILGRFTIQNRISLESSNPTYITQKRVLDKNALGTAELQKLFSANTDAILHQFQMHHDLYQGFDNQNSFILSYPFIPYQFKLISDVFDQFQKLGFVVKEVRDNARSVIGITHFTAKDNAPKEVGYFIPFDAFYNEMFRTNLTHRGSQIVTRALALPVVQKDKFAQRVVKVLFMISNLSQPVLLTFPPNIENMTALLMDNLDQNRLQLQKQVKDVLDKLQEESVIYEENNKFFFYSEDEISVTTLIRNTTVSLGEKNALADKIIRPILNIDQKYKYGQNDFRIGYWVEDSEILRGGDIKLNILLNSNKELQQLALEFPSNDLVIAFNEWFMKDTDLRKDFDTYVKTITYLKHNQDSTTGDRRKTHEKFSERNANIESRIKDAFIRQMSDTRFISQNRIIEASEINGTTPKERYNNLLEKHFSGIYQYHKLSVDYCTTANELRLEVVRTWQSDIFELTPAEQYVNDYISQLGDSLSVEDIIKNFTKAPFGWKDIAIIHVLVQLNRKKKREFEYNNQPRYSIKDFVEKAISTAERSRCIVKAGEEISQEVIDQVRETYRYIFNTDLPATTDGNRLYEDLVAKLSDSSKKYIVPRDEYYGSHPFGNHFNTLVEQLNNLLLIRDPRKLFRNLSEQKELMKENSDNCKQLTEFATNSFKEYIRIRDYKKLNENNFVYINDIAEKVKLMDDMLCSDFPVPLFRQARLAFEEIKKALNDLLKELRTDAVKIYEEIFNELAAEAARLKVDDAHVYADRQAKLDAIAKLASVADIKLKVSEAPQFKAEQLALIIKVATKPVYGSGGETPTAREPKEFYISKLATLITNEEEMEAYLAKAKEKMLKLLHDNKTIIIR